MAEDGFTIEGDPNTLDNIFRGVGYSPGYFSDEEERLQKIAESGQEYGVFVKDRLVGTTGIKTGATQHEFQTTDTGSIGTGTIGQRIEDFVNNQGMEIPDSIAKWRASEKGYDVETSVDDVDDALAALGATEIQFKPVDKLEQVKNKAKETAKQADEQAGNYSNLTSFLIAIPALAGLLTLVYRRFN